MADSCDQTTMKQREGGWGYIIIGSVFLQYFITLGFYQTQTFFFVEWQQEFSTSSAEASVLVSICSIVLGVSSPISGILATIFGTRVVVITGGLLAAVGMICTMVMESTLGIILTWGVMIGFGFALVFNPSVVMISQYFDKHFTVANGVAYAGGSVGQICYPLMTGVLIDSYGWRGAVLVLSAVMCHLIVSGVMLRPKRAEKSANESKESTYAHNNPAFDHIEHVEAEHELSIISSTRMESSDIQLTSDTRHSGSRQDHADVIVHHADINDGEEIKHASKPDTFDSSVRKTHKFTDTVTTKTTESDKKTTCENNAIRRHWVTILSALKSIFKNILFDIMLVVFFIFGMLFYTPIAHAIPRALEAGISESKAALLPTVFGIGNLIGRVAPTFIADFLHIQRGVITACAFAICSILNFLNPFFNTYWHHTVYQFIYGTASGTQLVFLYTIIQVILHEEHRVMGVGFALSVDTLGNAAGAVSAGWMVDVTGSYKAAFWFLSGMAAIGAILMIYVTFIERTLRVKTWISSCLCKR
ncbi:monocarboxylate transporter 2-like isoform X2 [Amphiura filiformis]|uniref:monocarboxylate transporter 2-like isoform X2 n=1 Tax=Amphiura filiformis TaxID=82378 RepID=UPI003B226855